MEEGFRSCGVLAAETPGSQLQAWDPKGEDFCDADVYLEEGGQLIMYALTGRIATIGVLRSLLATSAGPKDRIEPKVLEAAT